MQDVCLTCFSGRQTMREVAYSANYFNPTVHFSRAARNEIEDPVLSPQVKHMLVLLVEQVDVKGLTVLQVDHTFQFTVLGAFVILEHFA